MIQRFRKVRVMVRKILVGFVTLSFCLTASFAQEVSRGELLFQKCTGCHGKDGHNKAFGKSAVIAGQPINDLVEVMNFYRESDFQGHSSTSVMAKQTKALSKQDIVDVAEYVSKLK